MVKGQQRDKDRHRKSDAAEKTSAHDVLPPDLTRQLRHTPFDRHKRAETIPNGLPSTKPTRMPRLFEVSKLSAQLPVSTIPVFASANSGMMRKVTGLCKKVLHFVRWRCALAMRKRDSKGQQHASKRGMDTRFEHASTT